MTIFDNKTLDKLANLICGDELREKYCEDLPECPFYRKGHELPIFFRNAGLECPNHDGSGRKWWTLERLKYYNDQDQITLVIERIANPKEYSYMDKTLTVIKELNNIIAVEGLKINLSGNNPQITDLNVSIPTKEITTILDKVDFNEIILDESLATILNSRWEELENCLNSKSFLASLILMGSILEGALLHVVETNENEAKLSQKVPKFKGKIKHVNNWTLYDLIRVSHDCKWLDKDIEDFNHNLRDYRNLIHPRKQREERFYPDEDTCKICLEVVKAALNDLKRSDKNEFGASDFRS